MRRFEPRPFLLLLLLFAACRGSGDKSAAPVPTATVLPPSQKASKGGGNPALGSSEALKVAPYTLQDRYLEAARQGDRATIDKALERGAKVDAKDDLGRSALLLSVLEAGDLDLVRHLHEMGAPADEPDLGGRAALSWAAESGRLDMIRELDGWGAQIGRPDVEGRTPLAFAVLGGQREVVVFLLERGADANQADNYGDTPLIMACAKGYGEVASLLRQRGADPARKDQEGRTARDRAAPGTTGCDAAAQ